MSLLPDFPPARFAPCSARWNLFLTYLLPLCLLGYGIVPFSGRYYVLGGGFVFAVYRSLHNGLSIQDLGFTWPKKRHWSEIIAHTSAMAVAGYFILALLPAWLGAPRRLFWSPPYFLGYLLLVMIQQFLLTGFLYQQTRAFPGCRRILIYIGNAALVGIMHSFFGSWLAVMVITLACLQWHYLYLKTRSLVAACLPHFVQGALFIMHCYLCR